MYRVTIALLLLFAALPEVRGQADEEIFSMTGIKAGLCIYLGCDNARAACDLTNNGAMLVHCLAPPAADVAALREAVAVSIPYGLVTVESLESYSHLPYDDNMANLIVCDNVDQLKAAGLTTEEIMRILVPKGVVVCRKEGAAKAQQTAGSATLFKNSRTSTYSVATNGSYVLATKAPVPGLDTWTHYNHGPDGNPVSLDTVVNPPTHVKWQGAEIDAKMASALGGFRLENGRAFYNYRESGGGFYTARDAYNGTVLWNKKHNLGSLAMHSHYTASGDLFFCMLDKNGPVVALDGATGNVVREYAKSGWATVNAPVVNNLNPKDWLEIVCLEDKLIHTAIFKLHCVNIATGDLHWSYDAGAQYIAMVVASKALGVVFLVKSGNPVRSENRWPNMASSPIIVCLDLSTGAVKWENKDWFDKGIGQLIIYKDYLFVHASIAISGGGRPKSTSGVIRIADNKTLWQREPAPVEHLSGAYNGWVRNDILEIVDMASLRRFEMLTGKNTVWSSGYGNNGCDRGTATPRWISFGKQIFVNNQFWCCRLAVKRSACGTGAFYGYGQTYYTANGCVCIPQIDGGKGHMAMATSGSRQVVSNVVLENRSSRLRTLTTHVLRKNSAPGSPVGPIMADWPEFRRATALGKTLARTTACEGHTFTVYPGGQVIDISNGTQTVTAFTGGRISLDPVVIDNKAILSGRDGWIYAIDLIEMREVWRFRAAPGERLIMSSSQLESSWPVVGVSVAGDSLVVTAGRDVSFDGGLFTYRLDPSSGTVLWKERTLEWANEILAEQINLSDNGSFQHFAQRQPPSLHRAFSPAIYDLQGRKIVRSSFRKTDYYQRGLPAGMYVAKALDRKKGTSRERRFCVGSLRK